MVKRRLQPALVRRLLVRLREHLSVTDFGRVSALAELLHSDERAVSAAVAHARLFPDAARDNANKALSRLLTRLNEVAEEHRVELRLCITEARSVGAEQRLLWFEGDALPEATHTMDELERVGGRLITDSRGLPLSTEPNLVLSETRDGQPVVRWFLSYAHDDRKLAEQLRSLLDQQLQNSDEYRFELWHDGKIVVGEDWRASIRMALSEAHLGVFLISHAFLGSDFVKREEWPAFVAGHGDGVPGKRVVPVMLEAIDLEHTDLRGLERRQLFRDNGQKAFEERKGHLRKAWIGQLKKQLHVLIKRHGVVAGPERAPTSGGTPGTGALGTKPRGDSAARRMLERSFESGHMLGDELDRIRYLVEDAPGRPTSLDARQLERDAATAGEGVPAIEYLLDWLAEAGAPSLFALLGEYGMGKTITCQRLVRELERLRREGKDTLPEPLYFDLRRLTGLRNRPGIPTLLEILDECISRGWQLDAEQEKPRGRELLARAEERALLFVFDGLDEALVHLNEVDGQAFTRELLRLQPRANLASSARRHAGTRILISCRTHFFRTLRAQNNHFTGQERDATTSSDYRALVLCPFRDEQIRSYFEHALPDLDVDATLEMVRSVHNLSELAERPFTLRLVTEFIPQIERWRAEGRRLFGVTLYREMVQRWMKRDEGKHHLKPEHKQRLMMTLAAWMWRRGQRSIAINELEPWFHAWLEGEPDLRLRYRDIDRDKLEEDLRTATFLVREGAGGDAATEGFRFAHTSMQEFFLALFLFEAVERDRREDWRLPRVSQETFAFFAQCLQESREVALVQRLGAWRSPYLPRASEHWLVYCLLANARGWPSPSLAGASFVGANLQGWAFIGRSENEPLNLSGADFRGADLGESTWHDVRLDGARFDGAQLRRTEWWRVKAPRASLVNTEWDGAKLRQCALDESNCGGARGRRVWMMSMGPPSSWPQPTSMAERVILAPAPKATASSGNLKARLAIAVGHIEPVNAVAFSPDGARVVSSSYDKTLKLWESSSGQCLATWAGHEKAVTGCAFSPDGSRVISSSYDKTLKHWESSSGQCLATWAGHEEAVTGCAFSPDGSCVVSSSQDKTLKLWESSSGQCLGSWNANGFGVMSCAFSPDGSRIVSSTSLGTVELWDSSSRQCLVSRNVVGDWVTSCAFSPSGSRIVSSTIFGTLSFWDTRSGQCLASRNAGRWVKSCAFSPNGLLVVCGSSDGTLEFWDVASGQRTATWAGHRNGVSACAFSPDGLRVVSASDDHTVKCWDFPSGQCLAIWAGHEGMVASCAFSPDGLLVVSAGYDKTLKLWDVASGQCLATWSSQQVIIRCAFSPDGSRLVCTGSDGALELWDSASGQCLANWSGHNKKVNDGAFSPDGARVISASQDGTLELWDAASGHCLATWLQHQVPAKSCAFLPGGKTVISTGSHGMFLWDVDTGRIFRGHHIVGGEHVVIDSTNDRVIEASEGAWRWLVWQLYDDQGRLVDVVPGETFGPLPTPQRLAQ